MVTPVRGETNEQEQNRTKPEVGAKEGKQTTCQFISMNINQSVKILLISCSQEEVNDSVLISNKLAGIEYVYIHPFDMNMSKLRVLEFTWNTMDVELWNYNLSDDQYVDETIQSVPPVCFMDSCGLILVSNEAPIQFINRYNSLFNSFDFPILWIANEKYLRGNPLESSLQSLNLTKLVIKSPEDAQINNSFNEFLLAVHSYLFSGGRG